MVLPWIIWLLLHLLIISCTSSEPSPGLRRVPKVYNALITSDQNLAPSRAYPVYQPVVQRTAFGYISPYYWANVPPGYIGPDGYPAPPPPLPPTVQVPIDAGAKDADDQQKNKEMTEAVEDSKDPKEAAQVPVAFYPNYQSTYFNPYYYGYNAYPYSPPGTYYVNYQPPGPFIPPPPPYGYPAGYPGNSAGGAGDDGDKKMAEKQQQPPKSKREKTTDKAPDVPPPPVPIKRSL